MSFIPYTPAPSPSMESKGAANGIASLDSGGKVPGTQLPSYVDDVLEYASTSAFPSEGETGKIYVALDTNKSYRWSGTTYVELSSYAEATQSASGLMSSTDKTKLDGVAAGAQVNPSNQTICNLIYPVGSIYMSVNNTSPATLFGGTWSQLKDRFLLGAGDTYTAGNTGGAASQSYTPAGSVGNHTLTSTEIPSHSHSLNSHTHSVGAHSHGLNSHTHKGPNHKHSVGAHSHGLNSHKHSVGAHSHGLNSHKHSVGAHSHGLNSHTHTGPRHAHTANTMPCRDESANNWGLVANGAFGDRITMVDATNSYLTSYSGDAATGAASGSTANSTAFDSGAASGSTANSTAFDTGAASGSTANSTAFDSGEAGTGNTGAASGSTANSTAFDTGAASGNTASTGGGGAHNHGFTGTAATINTMPPYLVVYMWKRTA